MNVAVLMVNWSTTTDFERALSTLRLHEGDVPVMVYQNFHSKDVAELAKKIARKYGVLFFHDAPDNRGHGFGINILAQIAYSARYFFIANPDLAWTEPVLERLQGFLEEDPNRCIVGPKQMDSKNRITAAGIFGSPADPKHRGFHEIDPSNSLYRDTQEAVMVAGSAMFMRSADFREFGGMTETTHYYSETFLNYHAKSHGRSLWYFGEPWMIHDWHTSSPLGSPLTDGKFADDREIFRSLCDTHEPPIPHD